MKNTKECVGAKAKYKTKFPKMSIPTGVLLSGVHNVKRKPQKNTIPKR